MRGCTSLMMALSIVTSFFAVQGQAKADTTVTFPEASDTWDYNFYPYMFFEGDKVTGQRAVDTLDINAVSYSINADTSFLYCETQVNLYIEGQLVSEWMVQPFEATGVLTGSQQAINLTGGDSLSMQLHRISPDQEDCGSLILTEGVSTITFHGSGSSSAVDEDEDGFDDTEDCDDTNPDIYPGADEPCDDVDNDCDNVVDEEGESRFYPDGDGDGYGVASGSVLSCDPPSGYVSNAGDCDDGDPDVNPGAAETCDGLDENCNGLVDDGAGATWYRDADRDGYGDIDNTVEDCDQPAGYVAVPGDCDDTSGGANPGAPELCDGIDNNCDGLIDIRDVDNDGYDAEACGGDDCNDNRADINPAAEEVPDDFTDNDCDGMVDETGGTGCPSEGKLPTGVAYGWMGLLFVGFAMRRRRN